MAAKVPHKSTFPISPKLAAIFGTILRSPAGLKAIGDQLRTLENSSPGLKAIGTQLRALENSGIGRRLRDLEMEPPDWTALRQEHEEASAIIDRCLKRPNMPDIRKIIRGSVADSVAAALKPKQVNRQKPLERAREILKDLYPNALPRHFSRKEFRDEVNDVCVKRGWRNFRPHHRPRSRRKMNGKGKSACRSADKTTPCGL